VEIASHAQEHVAGTQQVTLQISKKAGVLDYSRKAQRGLLPARAGNLAESRVIPKISPVPRRIDRLLKPVIRIRRYVALQEIDGLIEVTEEGPHLSLDGEDLLGGVVLVGGPVAGASAITTGTSG
jgi:hypothetical protein